MRDLYFAARQLKWRIWNALRRTHRRLWPVNATCNNDDCGYRGRRTRRGKWCPACWEDGGGELIRDQEGTK